MSPSATDPFSIGNIDASPSSKAPSAMDILPDELLLAILGVLLVKARAKVRTVSKKWNNLVVDADIHLEPLFVDDQEGIPFYPNEVPIRLHPWIYQFGFDSPQRNLAPEFPHASLTMVAHSYAMDRRRSEFLTDPPISTLAIQASGPYDAPRQPMHNVTVLRMTTAAPTAKGLGGIRLGDLLDAYSKMRAYNTNLNLSGWDLIAWFATTKNGFTYEKVGEHISKNGIEVRKGRKT